MRERYISTVMETIDPPVSSGLTDAKVIELWTQRQRSPLTRSVYLRDIPPADAHYRPGAFQNQRSRSRAIRRNLGRIGPGAHFPGPHARRRPQLLSVCRADRVLRESCG